MKISLTPFALNSSYFSMYTGACELQEGVNAPGTPTLVVSRSVSALSMKRSRRPFTYNDGLASGREHDRFGNVIFLERFLKWELISWLSLMLSEECRRLCVGGLDCTGSEVSEYRGHGLKRGAMIASHQLIVSYLYNRDFLSHVI